MQQGASLALKAKVVDHDEDLECEDVSSMDPEELKIVHRDYVALAARTFWKNPSKAKAQVEQKFKSSGYKEGNPKMKTCFNCQDRFHYVAECPYENREEHGGRLILKNASRLPSKKPIFKKNFPNKKSPSRMVLVTREEYLSGIETDEEETTNELAAIAISSSSTPSLFESPNENIPNQSAKCLMVKATEVSSSSHSKTINEMDDIMSLRVKKENVAWDRFMTNLQGEAKERFEAIMSDHGRIQEELDEKERLEREYANDIGSLTLALEEERELRVSLEEKLENLDESQNAIFSQIIKERDHAIAKYKLFKKEKVEFGVVHDKLVKELEEVTKAHKALENEHSTLSKSFEQLQIQSSKTSVPSSSTIHCDHANIFEELASLKEEMSLYQETNEQLEAIIKKYGLEYFPSSSTCDVANILEENVRLKKELAKISSSQGYMPSGDPLSKRWSSNKKEGLGYVPLAKKKKNKKNKAKPAQVKKTTIASSVATRGTTPRSDFAGNTNPNYILYVDYYGDVYAKYVGPYDGSIAYSIWVPKTLVANQRGPIAKWVPKNKQ